MPSKTSFIKSTRAKGVPGGLLFSFWFQRKRDQAGVESASEASTKECCCSNPLPASGEKTMHIKTAKVKGVSTIRVVIGQKLLGVNSKKCRPTSAHGKINTRESPCSLILEHKPLPVFQRQQNLHIHDLRLHLCLAA